MLSSLSHANGGFQIWRDVARDAGLEPEILYAIALIESRTLSKKNKSRKEVQAWPWTLNSSRYGSQFFKSKKEALEDLMFLIDEGYSNIDIGIMQINWKYNGKRMVGDLALLLDPEINIITAGKLLKELMKRSKYNVFEAVAKYHNPKKEIGHKYAHKVLSLAERLKEYNDSVN